MVKRDLSLQWTRFHCSRVQWWRALHHSSRCLALRMVLLGLCTAARPSTPISWRSRRTVLVLTLLSEAVWNSVVSVATEDRWFLHITRFSTQVLWACLPLCGWAIVAPRRFHFTITALTVDRSSSSRAEMWRIDMLERGHPMTVPRWKSLSPQFIHLSATGVAEITESTNVKCPHTFGHVV